MRLMDVFLGDEDRDEWVERLGSEGVTAYKSNSAQARGPSEEPRRPLSCAPA